MKRIMEVLVCCYLLSMMSYINLGATIDHKTRGTNKDQEKHFIEDEFGELHHNPEYDHAAFLGKEEAKSFDQLTPEESKERLKLIVKKIDKNEDGFVDRDELIAWIKHAEEVYINSNVNRQWKDYQGSEDSTEKLTWNRYKERMYGQDFEDADTGELTGEYKEMLRKDERRWGRADVDRDGLLDKEEFKTFLHPEEFPHMADLAGLETLEEVDKNKDGVVTLEEYIADLWPPTDREDSEEEEPEWVTKERSNFAKQRDLNGDGHMDLSEIQEWIAPKDYNNAALEAEHLIREADDDKDGKLMESEIINKYDIFVGSQATDYGEALVRHDEF